MDRARARQIASGVAFLAVCAIAVLIVVSQTGGGSGGDTKLEDVGLVDLPFPLLLDENYQNIEKLGIRGDQAKPSTYIIDKQGKVRFAYVGATTADRPSIKALLDQLDALGRG